MGDKSDRYGIDHIDNRLRIDLEKISDQQRAGRPNKFQGMKRVPYPV